MKRASMDRHRTIRVWREHIAGHGPEAIACKCELKAGRFRKGQRAGGCGRPRCYLCHMAKLTKRAKIRQVRADVSYREWVADISA